MFEFNNPNPHDNITGDCVVRAISIATKTNWNTVYKDLCEVGFEVKAMPNSKEAWELYLKRKGFKYVPLKIKRGESRKRVYELAEDLNGKLQAIGVITNHIVAIDDNKYHDIWDCGDRALFGYWIKEK